LGYSTIWLTGGPLQHLGQISEALETTRHVRVAPGIISVDRFPADEVSDLYKAMEQEHRGRFIVGLGGAHGTNPFETIGAYLDDLESVPLTARVLAALGPRMLGLARERAGGALPVLVTPGYTAQARNRLGEDTTLAVEQLVVLDTNPESARETARGPLRFLGTLPAYMANFRRMGFGPEETTALSDRLVDSLVAWGDAEAIAARVTQQRDAGADHVAVNVIDRSPDALPVEGWRQLATALRSS
jgi:probable F420-dependent oxidoreductase